MADRPSNTARAERGVLEQLGAAPAPTPGSPPAERGLGPGGTGTGATSFFLRTYIKVLPPKTHEGPRPGLPAADVRQLGAVLALEKVVDQLIDFYTEKPEEPTCIKSLTLVASAPPPFCDLQDRPDLSLCLL